MKPGDAVYSPEFELVLACLRWPQEAADGDRIRSLAQQPLRWTHLLEIVHHHKVVPLFSRNLNTFAAGYIPDDPAAALRASSVANAHNCLQRTADLFSLNRLFREQQIDLRIFKGIPLAITAFHDPTLRDTGDIDLLVAEKDIFPAGEILRAQGYLRFEPQARLTPRRLRSYLAHQKDFSYEHPETGSSSTCTGVFSATRGCPPTPVSSRLARTGSILVPSAFRHCPLRSCCSISACMERSTAGCALNGWPISRLFCAP